MSRGLRNSQNITYLGVLLLVSVVTVFTYQRTNQEWILFRKAEDSFSRKGFAAAIPLYLEAIAAGAVTNTVFHHLGESYLQTHNHQEAVKVYEKLHLLYPEDIHAIKNLASLYAQFARFDEAIALYRGILKDYPESRPARIGLARVLGWSGRLDEAIAEYKKILGESPQKQTP